MNAGKTAPSFLGLTIEVITQSFNASPELKKSTDAALRDLPMPEQDQDDEDDHEDFSCIHDSGDHE